MGSRYEWLIRYSYWSIASAAYLTQVPYRSKGQHKKTTMVVVRNYCTFHKCCKSLALSLIPSFSAVGTNKPPGLGTGKHRRRKARISEWGNSSSRQSGSGVFLSSTLSWVLRFRHAIHQYQSRGDFEMAHLTAACRWRR